MTLPTNHSFLLTQSLTESVPNNNNIIAEVRERFSMDTNAAGSREGEEEEESEEESAVKSQAEMRNAICI